MQTNKPVFLALVLLFISNFGSAQNTVSNWKMYFSVDSIYQISFPGKVFVLTDTLQSDFGPILKRTIFTQDTVIAPGVNFSVTEFHYPAGVIDGTDPETINALFDATIDGSLSQTKGILDYRSREELAGFAASVWRITYDSNRKVVRHKAVIIGDVMMILQVSMPVKGSNSRVSDKFMNTFRIDY